MTEWHQELEQLLIRAGTTGLKQKEIIIKMQGYTTAEPIEEYLMALASEGKVQRFTVQTRGRPTKIWRATSAMLV
jgi:hypothetical protein